MTKKMNSNRHPQTPKKEAAKSNASKNVHKNTPVTPSQLHIQNQLISPMNLSLPGKFAQLQKQATENALSLNMQNFNLKSKVLKVKRDIGVDIDINIDNRVASSKKYSRKEASNQKQVEKKSEHSISIECQDGNTSSFLLLPHKRKSQIQSEFPFGQQRKSYRKICDRVPQFIQSRRNQDSVQRKINCVINKLIHDKFCQKEILGIAQKMVKLDSKELLNRYIISGFQTILKLVQNSKTNRPPESSQNTKENILTVLRETKNKVMGLLDSNLDSWQEFQSCFSGQINVKDIQSFLARKIYRILKKIKRNQYSGKLKDNAIKIANSFILKDQIQFKSLVHLLQQLQNESLMQIQN